MKYVCGYAGHPCSHVSHMKVYSLNGQFEEFHQKWLLDIPALQTAAHLVTYLNFDHPYAQTFKSWTSKSSSTGPS